MVGPEGSRKLMAIFATDVAGYSRLNALINSDERLNGDAREGTNRPRYRGRDARYRAPPAQIPAGAIYAPGSHLG